MNSKDARNGVLSKGDRIIMWSKAIDCINELLEAIHDSARDPHVLDQYTADDEAERMSKEGAKHKVPKPKIR